MCRCTRLCQALAPGVLSFLGQCVCCLTPQQALAPPYNHHRQRWAELPPTNTLSGCRWPLPWPHPCTPTPLPGWDHRDIWVLIHGCSPVYSLDRVGPHKMGTSWLCQSIWTHQWPQSLSPCGWCILTLGMPARRGCRAGLWEPKWGRLTAEAGQSSQHLHSRRYGTH